MYIERLDIEDVETVAKEIEKWSMGLWYGSTIEDMEDAGIDKIFLAYNDDDNIIGFQTVSGDGLCIAIEVHPDWRGKGVATAIIDESYCYRPERNENEHFWEKMNEIYA
jgi:GNAT superfamily N-acetyltransferase